MTSYTIILVLRSGGDFEFRDVELISRHINMKWKDKNKPRIICLWDKASRKYNLGNIEIVPLTNNLPGTWSRMQLYSPEMEQYRPYLYVDLDTAVIQSLEHILALIKDPSMFITLEDFWQKGQLATGLVWFPAKSDKIKQVWAHWSLFGKQTGWRMDYYLRKVVKPDMYWQHLTGTIYDFKPTSATVLTTLPEDANLVCFHGKPRIYQVVGASISVGWVKSYVEQQQFLPNKPRATVIISFKENRGWLQDAINSVPSNAQLILSKGNNGFCADFNKVLPQVEADYVRYLHDDDMLTSNCIEDSIAAMEQQGVDFIHGCVIELRGGSSSQTIWTPAIKIPTMKDMLRRNYIHSASVMYRTSVFDKVGGFDETLDSSEDYEFNLRCLANGLKIGFCPSVLAYYRRHPKQKVRTTSPQIQRAKRELIKSKYR